MSELKKILLWIHLICCGASNEAQTEQMGTSVGVDGARFQPQLLHWSRACEHTVANKKKHPQKKKEEGLISWLSCCLLSPLSAIAVLFRSFNMHGFWVSIHYVSRENNSIFFQICMRHCTQLHKGQVMRISLASEPWLQWSWFCNNEVFFFFFPLWLGFYPLWRGINCNHLNSL